MDQRAREKEKEEGSSEDMPDHRCKDDFEATADEGPPGMNNHGDSMDQQRDGGYDEEAEEEETPAGGVLKEVVGGSEEEASAPLLAHPCSLLRLLLRACAGCLGLHGYCSVDGDPKPASDDGDDVPAAVADADSPQEGDYQGDGGDKAASCLYLQQEVVTEVWAVRRRRPPPPRRPREGPGGNGGNHH